MMSEIAEKSIYTKSDQHKGRLFLYAISLLCLLSVTRIYRNSVGYENTQQGGIWNIITLVFWMIAVIIVTTKSKKILREVPICLAVVYSVTVQFNAFAQIKVFSVFNVYNIRMLSFFTCVMIVFYHAYHGPLLHKELLFVRGCVLFIFVFSFYSMFAYRTGIIDFSMVADAYYALCVLPLYCMVEKNTQLRKIAYWIVGVIIIFSSKRAGLIAFASFAMLTYIDKNQSFFKRLVLFALSLSVIFYGYSYLVSHYDLDIIGRLTNIANDGGSGRSWIYATIYGAICEAETVPFFFGHGFGSIEKLLVIHENAHNDFLEIIYSYGILPSLAFIGYYASCFFVALKMKMLMYPKYRVFLGGILINLMLSMFSVYCVGFAYVICGSAFVGYALSDWNYFRISKKRGIV